MRRLLRAMTYIPLFVDSTPAYVDDKKIVHDKNLIHLAKDKTTTTATATTTTIIFKKNDDYRFVSLYRNNSEIKSSMEGGKIKMISCY